MAIIFLILYWIIIGILLVTSIMVAYHIWIYYLNRKLAILTIAIFSLMSLFLFLVNIVLFFKIDWSFLALFFQNAIL
jgi:hypothetical protein